MVANLYALRQMQAAYVLAAIRLSLPLSILSGAAVFGEGDLKRRMLAGLIMLAGVVMLLFA